MADVKAGERIDIRMHLTNTGAAIGTTDELALFYDKNDGIWTKVQSQKVPNLGSGDCDTDTNFDCLAVDVTDDVGSYSSMAISPDGSPSVAYYDTTNTAVMFAQFVGSGGTGCNGGSTNWSCEIVDNTGTAKGQYTSLAYDLAGNPWISYYDATGSQLVVAQYVGAGGSGCTSSAWTCENVDNTGTDTGSYTSIGFSAGGVPWVAYYDITNGSLRVAHREGSGFGSACTDADWRCGDVDADGDDIGKYTSIAFDADDDAWISYYDDTADALLVAEYVGTGGSGCGGASAFWTCETVDNTGTITGQYSSIAISPSGIPWVSFYDTTNANLRVAHREGSGFGSACTDTDWRCAPVDSTGTVGLHSSIAFAPDGNPWISYYDDDSTATNKALKYARFVGSSGTGCADTAWDGCGKIDSAGSDAIGEYSSLAFAQNGNAWISYYDGGTEGNLRVANVYRSGEIVLSPSVVNSNGTTINEDHADMTSATDTTNRDDTGANRCIASSTTWNDGIYSEAENLTGLTLAAGDTTSQCTEISWTIDTSQASAGEAYRFVVASKDALRPDKGLWRGPIAVATDAYPTLTIAGSAKDEYRYSKDTQPIFTNCSDSSWGCMAVDVTGSVGWDSNIAFDQSGSPWVAYVDAANADILVAKFVGSGGSGCDGGSSAWDCTIVDATGSLGEWISFAIDPKGHPWISYSNGSDTSLKVANYVGSGGNCDATGGSNLWQCTTVDATDQVGPSSSIAFDQNGNAWITYKDITNDNLEVAKYVGSGGNCDSVGAGSDAWQCTTVDVTDNVGTSPSIAFDTSGSAWIAYQDTTNLNLEIAKYVGSGGNCDSVGAGSDAWQCTTVDVTDDVGSRPSIAFDSSGDASVSYFDTTNSTLEMAKYVGSGGNCDSVGAGSDGWYCEIVDDPTNGLDNSVSIAFDASGKAWMAYQDYTDDTVKVAREVGSGGSGCTGSTNSGKWTCSTIDSTMTPTAAVNLYIDLAFDMSGRAFVSYYDITNENLKIAAPHLPLNPLSSDTSVSYNGRNAGSGDFRYRLDAGLAPRTDAMGTCQANENNLGYCGLYHPDGALDSITTGLNERPIYGFATKFTSNSELPHARAHFQTDVSPSTKNLKLQVYRYGTTNAWEDIATYSSAGCSSDNCVIEGGPTGTASEYFRTSGSGYEVNFRLYQIESSTVSITLMLDGFRASQVESFMRHGAIFRENLSDPFTW
jgi:hypothetical protein